MKTPRKITVEVPRELLDKAQKASGTGITQTVRTGLQLVAASRTYARLRLGRSYDRDRGRLLAASGSITGQGIVQAPEPDSGMRSSLRLA